MRRILDLQFCPKIKIFEFSSKLFVGLYQEKFMTIFQFWRKKIKYTCVFFL